jgi:hypothetical protein
LWVYLRSLPRQQDRFLSFDGFYVQVNHQNFFSIYSPSRHVWSPGPVLPRSHAYYLTLTWSDGKLQLWVSGVPEGRPVPFRGRPPRDLEALPPGSAPGTTRATAGVVDLAVPPASCGVIPCVLRGGARVLQWGKYLALISLPHARPLLSSRPCRAAAPADALPPLVEGGAFVIGRGGCERVEFLETYEKSWTLTAMSPGARVTGHRTADHYYNQWTVRGPPTAVYTLHYSGESSFLKAFFAGALIGLAYLGSVFGAEAVLGRRRPGRPFASRPTRGRHARQKPGRPVLARTASGASGRVDHRSAIEWHKPNAMPEPARDWLNHRQEIILPARPVTALPFDLDPICEPHATRQRCGGEADASTSRAGQPNAWPIRRLPLASPLASRRAP